MNNRLLLACSGTAVLAIGGSALLLAGPLDPPTGAVASTLKTLAEVEPRTAISQATTPGDADSLFKITQPGSYYLTGNIVGVAGKQGIEIAASGVTIDLMGFRVSGVPGMGAFDGIASANPSLINVTVRNGTVSDWGGEGIDLSSLITNNSTVVDVRASGNAGHGISVGTGCSVAGCSALSNAGSGINTGSVCSISNSTSYNNSKDGFTLSFGCTIAQCAASSNAEHGIAVSGGCTIVHCTTRSNNLDGIFVGFNCSVLDNTCSFDGAGTGNAAGIIAFFNDNRIEGNNCTGADRGIDVRAGGNIIIGNTCSGNATNWLIVANNFYGPIIDRTGVATAAVNGPAAAGTLATTDPHANFSY